MLGLNHLVVKIWFDTEFVLFVVFVLDHFGVSVYLHRYLICREEDSDSNLSEYDEI